MINKIRSIRMVTRQIIGFGAVLLLMSAMTIYAAWEVNSINKNLTSIIDLNSVMQRYAINFRGSVHDRAISLRDVVLDDNARLDQNLEDIRALERFYAESALKMDGMFANPANVTAEDIRLLEAIKEIEAITMPLIAEVIKLRQAGENEAAHTLLLAEARPAFSEWLKRINAFIDVKEALNQNIANETRDLAGALVVWSIILCAISVVIGAMFAWWNMHSAYVLRDVTGSMLKLAEGDIDVTFPRVTSHDEVGDIAKTAGIFRENAIERHKLEEKAAHERDRERQRQAHIEKIIETFREQITQRLDAVIEQADSMDGSSDRLRDVAVSATHDAQSASSATASASSDVEVVAKAAEELSSSIKEIEHQTNRAGEAMLAASQKAEETDKDVSQLAEAATQIGDVLSIIRDIAERTNLLALNATIEAARAGEAGRGFAIVAQEVKSLATQTAQATENIADQINGIQNSTGDAVISIREIIEAVGQVQELTKGVSGAVSQQRLATQDIANSVVSASSGTDEVTSNVTLVTQSIHQTSEEALSVKNATERLKGTTTDLQQDIELFLEDVTKDVAERRGALRVKMREVAMVGVDGRRISSTLIDCSITGAAIQPVDGINVGEELTIQMTNGFSISGKVVRKTDELIGVQFDEPLANVDQVMKSVA